MLKEFTTKINFIHEIVHVIHKHISVLSGQAIQVLYTA